MDVHKDEDTWYHYEDDGGHLIIQLIDRIIGDFFLHQDLDGLVIWMLFQRYQGDIARPVSRSSIHWDIETTWSIMSGMLRHQMMCAFQLVGIGSINLAAPSTP